MKQRAMDGWEDAGREHTGATYPQTDVALERAEEEQKSHAKGRSKGANEARAGVEDGCVCALDMCDMLCAIIA